MLIHVDHGVDTWSCINSENQTSKLNSSILLLNNWYHIPILSLVLQL